MEPWPGVSFRTYDGKGSKPVYIAEENVGEFAFAFQELPEDWERLAGGHVVGEGLIVTEVYKTQDGEPNIEIQSSFFERGLGTSHRFLVSVSEWKTFKTQMIHHLINLYY